MFDPDVDILRLCESLHGHNTGSADPLPDDEEKRVLGLLQDRLENWKESHGEYTRVYDEAVRNLVEAVLDEFEASI